MQNIYMNLDLLQRAYACGIRKILAIGTCFEFGNTAKVEQPLHPLSRLAPIGSYPSSKAAFCLMALDWAREHSVDLIYSRLFQVYGEGENPSRLFPSLLKKARSGQNFELKQPDLIRDFMHASKAAQQISSSLNSLLKDGYKSFPRVEHICTGLGTSLFDFAEQIWTEEKASGHLILSRSKPPRHTDLPIIIGMPLNVSYE
jgi:dTDP-6-deoxy-L-talose 4-dehydrogenase (NAD+)